ncbi:hypothetical protein I6F33_07400 [Bradyrhizobium sp. BRP20]|uniref:hypothetical protein n=1 Tax=Bradyrhizobium sp. BRP20 TaxID=2793822 RepID=UPI001CD38E0E|nr:hypothetical protein [Bradyrhizobium sp. BRP20]MCA1432801.1 hypothetical protein [Bradyrhizobium sp. BRP20]
MDIKYWATVAELIQHVITPGALIVGGIWAYRRYIVEESNYPHIETSAEISFIGQQGDVWIVEVIAVLTNKGKVPHKVQKFGFDLAAIYADEIVDVSKKHDGQVNFPHRVAKASFLGDFEYYTVGPSLVAKYSYVARVPKKATFLILHCSFNYADGRGFSHSMEKTVRVPHKPPEAAHSNH